MVFYNFKEKKIIIINKSRKESPLYQGIPSFSCFTFFFLFLITFCFYWARDRGKNLPKINSKDAGKKMWSLPLREKCPHCGKIRTRKTPNTDTFTQCALRTKKPCPNVSFYRLLIKIIYLLQPKVWRGTISSIIFINWNC